MTSLRPEIVEAFRERRVRCTPQRYAILEYLKRRHTHPTAEQIYKAVNRTVPRTSLATVYKALHALTEAGLLRQVALGGQAVRFESNVNRHHHFVCERCGRMEDVDWFDLPQAVRKAAAAGRKVASYELILRGLCGACARSH